MKKKVKKSAPSSIDITRLTRTMYFFVAVVALSIVVFDAGNLITKDSIVQRWFGLSVVLAVNTFVWMVNSQISSAKITQSMLVYLLTITTVSFAGFMSYWERGMASTSTLLYFVPLLCIAVLRNRHALLATAALSAGSYTLAAVIYFNKFFNEGYRIQLWGSIIQTVGIIFVGTWLIMVIADLRHDSK